MIRSSYARWFAALTVAAAAFSATTASAQTSTQSTYEGEGTLDQPVQTEAGSRTGLDASELTARYVDRPLVDPEFSLRVFMGPNDPRVWTLDRYRGIQDFGIGFERYAMNVELETPFGPEKIKSASATPVFRTGAAFTPIENLEVGIGFQFAGDGRGADDIPLWATFQFHKSDSFELGARLTMFMPAGTTFGMQGALPVIIRAGDILRIDTGVFMSFAIGGSRYYYRGFAVNERVYGRLSIPARFTFQFTDEIYGGFMTGLDFPDFSGFAMPLGFHVGYTLALDVAVLDFGLSFTWPAFIITDGDDDGTEGAEIYRFAVVNAKKPLDGNDIDMMFGANVALKF